jgi:hypothetical protein
MGQLQTIRRVTVYADAALEDALLAKFTELGSNGYTVVACRGKGEHSVVTTPFTDVTHVRIELLVQPAVAGRILDYLGSGAFQSRAVAACAETVEVAANERF